MRLAGESHSVYTAEAADGGKQAQGVQVKDIAELVAERLPG